jgi:hypothetical protein
MTSLAADAVYAKDRNQPDYHPERCVLIKKHCSATPDEVQAAIQAYKQKHYDAECLVVGMEFQLQNLKEAKAKLRRLSR